MILTKLKAKNQLTLPQEVVTRLNLKPDELFQVNIKDNYVKLIPVDVEPRYAPEELEAIDRVIEKGKNKAKAIKPGKEFSSYIRRITR